MLTQLEILERVVEIKKSNPELEIIILVDTNEISTEYDWSVQKIVDVEIVYEYDNGEEILMDYGEIMDYFIDILELSEEDAERKFRKEVKNVIAIKTGAMSVVGKE